MAVTMAPKSHPLQSLPSTRSNETLKPPHTFADAVYARLNNPHVSLFRLGIRLFQLIFALAAGISYAVELSHGSTSSAFIYSQVVFGLTLIMLIVDAVTLRSYRLTFVIESVLCVLWLALFGNFYQTFVGKDVSVDANLAVTDKGRMKAAVWLNLVNFLLWLASAIFSTAMCCSGTKAMIRGKLEKRRTKKQDKGAKSPEVMEEGFICEPTEIKDGDRLPLYEEIAAITWRA
jgi:hypothetical protein